MWDPALDTPGNTPPRYGLFEDQRLVDARVAEAKRQRKVVSLTDHPIGCDNCTLKARWLYIRSKQMRISGYKDADILFLGEAPGQTEDEKGKQFVGPSGSLLRENIPRRHLDRIAFQNYYALSPRGE